MLDQWDCLGMMAFVCLPALPIILLRNSRAFLMPSSCIYKATDHGLSMPSA